MYKKLITAVLGALVMTAYQFFDNQSISGVEWVQILAAGVGAYLVWQTANGPVGSGWNYAKTAAYALSAVLAELVTVLPDGLSRGDIATLVIVGLTGLGVLAVPGAPVSRPRVVSSL